MAKPWAKAFYSSPAWERCRSSFIAERILADGGLCEICHDDVGYIVHHVRELTPNNINDPLVTLNHSNLQYVCKKCHDKEHRVFCETEKNYFFDASGQIQPYPPLKNRTCVRPTDRWGTLEK